MNVNIKGLNEKVCKHIKKIPDLINFGLKVFNVCYKFHYTYGYDLHGE